MFAGVEAWFSCWPFLLVLHSGGFESWAPLSYLWHMYVFGKWISIQNLRELLIKGIKYQIKNSLSLQRLKFESQTPSERLESIRFLFGTCVWLVNTSNVVFGQDCVIFVNECVPILSHTELGFWTSRDIIFSNSPSVFSQHRLEHSLPTVICGGGTGFLPLRKPSASPFSATPFLWLLITPVKRRTELCCSELCTDAPCDQCKPSGAEPLHDCCTVLALHGT